MGGCQIASGLDWAERRRKEKSADVQTRGELALAGFTTIVLKLRPQQEQQQNGEHSSLC